MEKIFFEFFKLGFKNLKNRKLRSWLTMLGIFIGIAAIIALLSLGQGLSNSINEQFEQMGRDKIMVTPGQGLGLDGSAGQVILTEDDKDLVDGIIGVDITSGFLYKAIPVKYKTEQQTVFVMGVYTTGEEIEVVKSMQSWEILEGRELSKTDRYKALVGCLYAQDEKIYSKSISLKENIEILGQTFRVIGFMSCVGNNQDDSNVYIPMDIARELFEEPDKMDMLFVKVKPGFSPQLVADKIITKMRRDRDLKEGEENFAVQTSEQLIEVFGSILAIIQIVLVGIAGISLLVGGVGIMNTMYTSVMERTREIGIMKAIGARRRYILALFLIESGLMGAVGGVIGVIFGLMIAFTVEFIAKTSGFVYLNVQISPWLVLFGVGFAYIVGSVAGILPAIKAIKMQAVDALHFE
jgi:putative ABC transport system permease protein